MRMITSILVALTFMWVGVNDTLAQGLHFGVKGGVLGNKASVSGVRDNIREERLTGFQVGPMLQYQTGFYGFAFDFSLLYAQRGVKLTNTSNSRSTDIRTQSIDIPIEVKWEMCISPMFDLFLGLGPSFSFLIDKDNWGRELAHIAVDVLDKDLPSMGWRSTEVGLNLGGGVKLLNHLILSCYYNIGLTESSRYRFGNKHDAIDQIFDGNVFKSRNKYWQLSLAYVF